MLRLALVVCVVCGCKSKEAAKQPDAAIARDAISDEESPFDAAPELVVETKPVTIELPSIDRRPERGEAVVVAMVPGGWRRVDPQKIIVEKTRVVVPEGETVAQHQVSSLAGGAGVLVVAGAKTRMGDVAALAYALHNECWTFAALNQGALVGAWPNPCPVPPVDEKAKQLAVVLEKDRTTIGTRVGLDANNAMAQPPLAGALLPRR